MAMAEFHEKLGSRGAKKSYEDFPKSKKESSTFQSGEKDSWQGTTIKGKKEKD